VDAILVHLSDLHLRADQEGGQFIDQIISGISEFVPNSDEVFIVISGDVTFSGKAAEIEAGKRLISSLSDQIFKRFDKKANILVVPGNHDCDFATTSFVRTALVEKVCTEEALPAIDDESCAICTKIQAAFFQFRSDIEPVNALSLSDRLLNVYDFDINGRRLLFYCYNSSWVSQLEERPGTLFFPFDRYVNDQAPTDCTRVAVLHHPLNWFRPNHHRKVRDFLTTHADLVLTGHEHETRGAESHEHSGQSVVVIEGGVLDEANPNRGRFNVVCIDLAERRYQFVPIEIRKGIASKSEVGDGWLDFRHFPRRPKGQFEFTPEFLSRVTDPGATFTHSQKRQLTLSDVFVYQTLKKSDKASDRTERVSAMVLADLDDGSRAFVKGSEKSGKTTLLHQLTLDYQAQGRIPLFMHGKELARTSNEELKKSFARAVTAMYGEGSQEEFFRLDKKRRVLLLDDYDAIPVNEKHRHKVLAGVQNWFGVVVVTADDLFQIREILSEEERALFQDYEEFEILRFGHRLRDELIRKWNRIGSDERSNLAQLEAKDVLATRVINVIVGKNYVPAYPIFLLTMLQGVETGQSTDLQHSSYGHYYHLLIVQNLRAINLKTEQIDEIYNYITELAFFYFRTKRQELTFADLRDFKAYFETTYGLNIDLGERLKSLVRANILVQRGEYFSFKYSYIYYYFVAQYLAHNLQEPETRALIKDLCKHLYYSPYANIIVFLTHHSKDTLVIEEVLKVANDLFATSPVLDLKDTNIVNTLLADAPRELLRQIDVDKGRAQILDARDEEDEDEGRARTELLAKGYSDLDYGGKVNLALKAVEILGQLLRNYYGSLKLPTKITLLNESYAAPFRVLHDFFTALGSDVNSLIGALEKLLEKKRADLPPEERERLARKLIFDIAGYVTVGLIKKISSATGSENLKELYAKLITDSDSDAYRLIDISTKLDFPGQIPFEELQELAVRYRNNYFAQRVLQSLVIGHLYMFQTSDMDKQKLSKILGIDMKIQRQADVISRSTKMLKGRSSS
jgi:UDP-2,3-diacylglucosamine pyrophosphatase LpxH